MAVTKRVVFTQSWNKGGVRTILEQVQKYDPNVRVIARTKYRFLVYPILLYYLVQSSVHLNIHGWMLLRFVHVMKKLGLIRARIVYSLHSDPRKELLDVSLMEVLNQVVDHITFVSDFHRASAYELLNQKQSFKTKSSVIYYKMECTYQSSSSSFSPGNGRVGLITRLSKEKGIEDVCSILPDESIIWGDGPLLEQLKERYTNLKFPGVCQEVNEALNKIDIFVFSSAWGVWGISLLEAICARKRFIYPRNENWNDLFPEASHCLSYENGNINSFNKALENAKLMSTEQFEIVRGLILSFPQEAHYKKYASL